MPITPPVGESTPELEQMAMKRSKLGGSLAKVAVLIVLLAVGYGFARSHAQSKSGVANPSVNCMSCHGAQSAQP